GLFLQQVDAEDVELAVDPLAHDVERLGVDLLRKLGGHPGRGKRGGGQAGAREPERIPARRTADLFFRIWHGRTPCCGGGRLTTGARWLASRRRRYFRWSGISGLPATPTADRRARARSAGGLRFGPGP